jgi:hypothetical protein
VSQRSKINVELWYPTARSVLSTQKVCNICMHMPVYVPEFFRQIGAVCETLLELYFNYSISHYLYEFITISWGFQMVGNDREHVDAVQVLVVKPTDIVFITLVVVALFILLPRAMYWLLGYENRDPNPTRNVERKRQ